MRVEQIGSQPVHNYECNDLLLMLSLRLISMQFDKRGVCRRYCPHQLWSGLGKSEPPATTCHRYPGNIILCRQ